MNTIKSRPILKNCDAPVRRPPTDDHLTCVEYHAVKDMTYAADPCGIGRTHDSKSTWESDASVTHRFLLFTFNISWLREQLHIRM